jgi:2-phospho-L-lactate guanylyltransferase
VISALVPAKTLGEAKGRLAEILSLSERRKLALAMLEDVLTALRAVPAITAVAVVSPDSAVSDLVAKLGATPIAESANVQGINQALKRAVSVMSPRPDALIVVPSDLPELTPQDIEMVLDALPERGVAGAPSKDGGTSALALRPPDVIEFSFGPDSFAAHKREAENAGVPMRVVESDAFARDIDSPDDLRELLRHPADTATHRVLKELALAERLA